jgi:hypothetical protein
MRYVEAVNAYGRETWKVKRPVVNVTPWSWVVEARCDSPEMAQRIAKLLDESEAKS